MTRSSIPRYLTTAEAAGILRESPITTARRCARGQLAATKTGKAWRISEAAVAALLEPDNNPTDEPEYETAAERRRALGRKEAHRT